MTNVRMREMSVPVCEGSGGEEVYVGDCKESSRRINIPETSLFKLQTKATNNRGRGKEKKRNKRKVIDRKKTMPIQEPSGFEHFSAKSNLLCTEDVHQNKSLLSTSQSRDVISK